MTMDEFKLKYPTQPLVSEEYKNDFRERYGGEKNPMHRIHGRPCPWKGKKRPEHAALLSAPDSPLRGKHHTEEAKAKMSRAKKELWKVRTPPWIGYRHSEELKRKWSEQRKGPGNYWFGKKRPEHAVKMKLNPPPCMGKPQHPSYCDTLKGHNVRSAWERDVCNWLYVHNIEYQYEPEAFRLTDDWGTFSYIPDIYIPQWGVWWEIKGYWDEDSVRKVTAFQTEGRILNIIDRENIHMFRGDL